MKTYMLWHGGASYAVGSVDADIEEFDSLKDALRSFDARADFDPYYPCVEREPAEDGGQSAWLWFYDPRGVVDPYPDRVVECGPRGGLQVSRA